MTETAAVINTDFSFWASDVLIVANEYQQVNIREVCLQAGAGGGTAGVDRDQRQQQETIERNRGQDSVHFVVVRRQHPGRRDSDSVPRHIQDVV